MTINEIIEIINSCIDKNCYYKNVLGSKDLKEYNNDCYDDEEKLTKNEYEVFKKVLESFLVFNRKSYDFWWMSDERRQQMIDRNSSYDFDDIF